MPALESRVQQLENLARRLRTASTVRKLDQTASAAYSQVEAQALADKIDELVSAFNALVSSFGTGYGR